MAPLFSLFLLILPPGCPFLLVQNFCKHSLSQTSLICFNQCVFVFPFLSGCAYLSVVNMYSVNPLCLLNTIFIHLSLFAITASFAPICFAIKAKENDMLPLEKNRVRLDDDSDEDKVWFISVCSVSVVYLVWIDWSVWIYIYLSSSLKWTNYHICMFEVAGRSRVGSCDGRCKHGWQGASSNQCGRREETLSQFGRVGGKTR